MKEKPSQKAAKEEFYITSSTKDPKVIKPGSFTALMSPRLAERRILTVNVEIIAVKKTPQVSGSDQNDEACGVSPSSHLESVPLASGVGHNRQLESVPLTCGVSPSSYLERATGQRC